MTGSITGLGARIGVEVGGMDMEEEVKEAYEVVKRIDVLDVSVGAYPFYISFLFVCDADRGFWVGL
jgi:dynein heavy chain 1